MSTLIGRSQAGLEHRSPLAVVRLRSHINGVPGWDAMASRMEGGSARGIGALARHVGGWFKAWRKAWESDLSQNLYLWGIWQAFLYMATWKETKIIWNGKQRVLPPGSVVFGYRELAEKLQVSHSTISKWAKYLHDTGRISLEASTRGSLATVLNWAEYQAQEDEALTPDVHDADAALTRRLHEVDLREEVKKVRSKEGKAQRLSPDEIAGVIEEWAETLKHFEIDREISEADQIQITRAIQQFGAQTVRYAIRGARFEPSNETFKPKEHLSLARIFGRDKQGNLRVEKFVNLGAQNKPRKRETHRPEVGPC